MFDLKFLKDEITDESELFPSEFHTESTDIGDEDFIRTPIQRFRYRGKRESAKWNTFLASFDADTRRMINLLDRVESDFKRKCIGYLTENTTTCSLLMSNKQAVDYLRKGRK